MDPALLESFLNCPCVLETSEGALRVTIKDKLKLILQPYEQALMAKEEASGQTPGADQSEQSATEAYQTSSEQEQTDTEDKNRDSSASSAAVPGENSVEQDEPEDWRHVFRVAMPKGTIISSHFRKKHWKKGSFLFSEKHPDIANADYYGHACKSAHIDPRFTLVGRRLRKPIVPPQKLYTALRDLQNKAWALESTKVGQNHVDKLEWEKALKAFKHALEIEPFCVPALKGIGEVYITMKSPVDAIKYLERALKTEPKDEDAFRLLGKALSLMDPRQAHEYEKGAVYREILDARSQKAGFTPRSNFPPPTSIVRKSSEATPVPESEQGKSKKRQASRSRSRSRDRNEQRRESRVDRYGDRYHRDEWQRDRNREEYRGRPGYRSDRHHRDDRYPEDRTGGRYDSYVADRPDDRSQDTRPPRDTDSRPGSRYDSYAPDRDEDRHRQETRDNRNVYSDKYSRDHRDRYRDRDYHRDRGPDRSHDRDHKYRHGDNRDKEAEEKRKPDVDTYVPSQ